MFERYTDRARRTIVLSQDAARSMKHNYIGTEHLIVGLATEEGGVASRVLADQGVTVDALREQIEKIVGLGSTDCQGHIPFTPRTKKVLELALREALQLGHAYIGTEHLLLGLVREGEGIAAQALTYIKGDDWHAVLRTAVLDQLKGHAKAEQAQAQAQVDDLYGSDAWFARRRERWDDDARDFVRALRAYEEFHPDDSICLARALSYAEHAAGMVRHA